MRSCDDWVEVNKGTLTTHAIRYCGPGGNWCYWCHYRGSTPSLATGTTITVKLHTTENENTASGFFAVVTGYATVTTDVTGELANVS